MDTHTLGSSLRDIMEKGFDESFAAFCAGTFSSYEYPPEKLAAARMHAYYLRLFMETMVTGTLEDKEIPEGLREAFREVSERATRETLSMEHPSGMACCRSFVRNWCSIHSSGRKP